MGDACPQESTSDQIVGFLWIQEGHCIFNMASGLETGMFGPVVSVSPGVTNSVEIMF